MGIWSEKVEKISSGKEKSTILSLFYHCKINKASAVSLLGPNPLGKEITLKFYDTEKITFTIIGLTKEIGEDIFVKDTFLAVFVQKSGRTVTFLYEIGYFMGIYENT